MVADGDLAGDRAPLFDFAKLQLRRIEREIASNRTAQIQLDFGPERLVEADGDRGVPGSEEVLVGFELADDFRLFPSVQRVFDDARRDALATGTDAVHVHRFFVLVDEFKTEIGGGSMRDHAEIVFQAGEHLFRPILADRAGRIPQNW
jgi:hypothetical protein